jgi:glyoxylase-like metal-dependent hydrolase (beta-lactamase superfamily II)
MGLPPRVAARLAPSNAKLFLTTTHFHPEHAAGEPGFPPGTILIRDAAQQHEMEEHGPEMIAMFSKFSAQNKELLAGVVLRPPDVTFDQEATVDLGGVTARLLWFGGAHTKGDELTFVEPDRTLISGDVVQNKTIPNIFGDGGRELITEIRTQALGLKHQGVPAYDAAKQVSADLKTQHPDWANTNAAGFVKSVYAEPQ